MSIPRIGLFTEPRLEGAVYIGFVQSAGYPNPIRQSWTLSGSIGPKGI